MYICYFLCFIHVEPIFTRTIDLSLQDSVQHLFLLGDILFILQLYMHKLMNAGLSCSIRKIVDTNVDSCFIKECKLQKPI